IYSIDQESGRQEITTKDIYGIYNIVMLLLSTAYNNTVFLLQPAKLAEAFKYFVQGMGYIPSASMTRLMRSRTASGSSVTSLEGQRSRSHTGEGTRSRSHTGEGTRSRSHTGDGARNRSHTDTRIELTPNSASNAEQSSPKSMEVSC
uniref:Uncharacterized protein n=1 Tax=Strix occidentalis caurina TaxID=311401 RepID=A0A8D0EQE8_STROC